MIAEYSRASCKSLKFRHPGMLPAGVQEPETWIPAQKPCRNDALRDFCMRVSIKGLFLSIDQVSHPGTLSQRTQASGSLCWRSSVYTICKSSGHANDHAEIRSWADSYFTTGVLRILKNGFPAHGGFPCPDRSVAHDRAKPRREPLGRRESAPFVGYAPQPFPLTL